MNHRDRGGLSNFVRLAGEDYHFERGHKTGNLYIICWNHSLKMWQIPEIGQNHKLWRNVRMGLWHFDNKAPQDRFQMRVNAIADANERHALRIKAGTFGQLDRDSNHKRMFTLRRWIGRQSALPMLNFGAE